MNEQDFYQTLSTKRGEHRAPANLAERIDEGIHAATRRKHTTAKRLTWAFGLGTAVVAVACYPSVRVYATVSKMKRAIENVKSVRVSTKVYMLNGATKPGPTTYYKKDALAYVDASGHLEGIQDQTNSFFWDPTIKKYVRRASRGGGIQSLSEMLQPSSPLGIGSGWTVNVIEVNGDKKLKAVLPHPQLNERYTFVADPATDLIESYQVDGKVNGVWIPRLMGTLDYSANITFPSLSQQAQVLSEAELGAAQVKTLGSSEIARKKIGKSTLVIRKVERTESGLIFVVYQAGNKDRINDPMSWTWRGYATQLSDDLGTTYVHVGEGMQLKQLDPKEPELGMYECEVFAPAEPLGKEKPSRFSINAVEGENNKVARLTYAFSVFEDGTFKGYWIPQNGKLHRVINRKPFDAELPEPPTWLSVFNTQPNEIDSMVARFRAKYYTGEQVWDRAEHYQLEAIRLTKELEARGGMPYDISHLETKLQRIREHSFKD
ncbi:MAG TPA: hypothetical protein VK171_09830 [Fimbriimonas sp.]|nr:hypothetical protein [Fimbriimonas sp.]